jgi:phage virion morphogenesis protein
MSLAVRVSISDDSPVVAALNRLALDRGNKADLFNEIGINLVENARLRFTDQEAPDGTPWEPSLRVKLQGGDTMRDKGILLASLTHAVLPEGVEYGTNVAYAPTLHFGATIQASAAPYLTFRVPGGGWAKKKEVVIPARPFIGLSTEDEELVTDIIANFLRVQ